MMKLSVLAMTVVCALPLPTLALAIPEAGPRDYRVKFVDYNADEVFRIKAFYQRNLRIELSPGEKVVDIGIGDPIAWDHVPSGNNIFIKPKLEDATTNMAVVTNRRTYEFELHAAKPPVSGQYVDLTYAIKFRYPEEQGRLLLAQTEKQQAESRLDTRPDQNPDANWNYWVQGKASISPDRAFDDKRFTYLTFTNNKDMPAVYAVNEAGEEYLVNTHVEGDVIVVHKVAPKLVMRKGELAACVFNRSFDPTGTSNATGTVSGAVKRVIRKRGTDGKRRRYQ
jgi:type IV secretion system protein VirB9